MTGSTVNEYLVSYSEQLAQQLLDSTLGHEEYRALLNRLYALRERLAIEGKVVEQRLATSI